MFEVLGVRRCEIVFIVSEFVLLGRKKCLTGKCSRIVQTMYEEKSKTACSEPCSILGTY